ncbi:MAG: serine/threonine-protein kinase [Xanthomonadales bacterium]|nr:serine/threonine-protein kinase [Xanthomonadales bacterium]
MSAPPLDRYADTFERLAALPEAERETALAALTLSDDERALLRRMLAADAEDFDPLAQALGAGAERLSRPRDDRLGPYRLLRELGAGGMGTVFLAERVDGGFAQKVAIKLLRGFPTADGLRRLRQERQILADLDHPHIARLIDGGETADGQPWLALEYIDGLPLLDHAAGHAPRLAERLLLFDAILDAVGHAHQRLVVHRDIKPGNVMVTAAGEVKLLDFGIARLVELDAGPDDDRSTRVFSAGHASPEQRAGAAITTASDIYSLGVLLRDLVAGARPSRAQPDAEMAGILAKATDVDPARRYASAGAFRDDLERYRDGRPVRAAPLTRRYRLRKFIGRHRLAFAAAVFASIALALFVWRLDHERGRAVAAEMAASRDAHRARAALEFLTDAFTAAAPDNALAPTVSVRELLDTARASLDARRLDPVIARPLQRLLGGLYAELGDNLSAAELLALGTGDVVVADRDEALALALDLDHLAQLQAMNGRFEAALAAAAAAADLRQHHAPEDGNEQVRNFLALAQVHLNGGDNPRGLALLRQAQAGLSEDGAGDPELALDVLDLLVMALANSNECPDALTLGEAGLARIESAGAAPAARIQFLRSLGTAHSNCGDAKRAESLYRSAIAEQQALVGSDGGRMSGLVNDLGVALSLQGRYREAAEALAQADVLDRAGAVRPGDYAIVLSNRASQLESAGDYVRALDVFDRAIQEHASTDLPVDAELRRRVRRSQARTLALAGQPDQAVPILKELREQARRLDGDDSIEYLMCTWQLALAERRRSGRLDSAERYLREAETGFAAILPETHMIFAHAMRQHGALALARGQPETAAAWFERALAFMAANDAAGIDIAIARSELAAALAALDRSGQARTELEQALPVLRELLLPTEVSRAEAEQLAARLGLPASAAGSGLP